ncbi:hypothetical protein JMJ35_005537 [Cladonia borealis]|uniref:Uncharacterized protein n=1 Tax=Cladonia borealis TaxID=184061 RepID=A0AA39R215_9LECA|nr:hypothetical protein JMJ35_005537 [Cladonia borealis]
MSAGFGWSLSDVVLLTRLSEYALTGRCHNTCPKVKWAFSAAKELGDFWIVLARQLESVKLLVLSETYAEVGKTKDTLASIGSKVTENLGTSNTTDQQIRSLSSNFDQSRPSVEVSLTLMQDLCRNSNLILHEFRTDNNQSIKDITAKIDAFSNDNSHTVASLAVLNHEVSSLNAQIGDSSSALLDMEKKEEQKSDTAVGLIQGLHTLVRHLHDDGSGSQQAVQYARIQDCVNNLQGASRNGMTRRLNETLDSAGARLEGRLVVESFSPSIRRGLRMIQQLARLQYHSLTIVHLQFEDFLGEVHWLDTSSFVHYQVPYTFLNYRYKNGSAHHKIQRNEFNIHLEGNPGHIITERNWDEVSSKRVGLVMSAVVAPSMNRYCLKCSEPSPTLEQGASYHCKKCSTHCHFQESALHTGDSESSQEEIPAASPDPSKNTPKSSVDVDLSLFKNLSTILYRRLQTKTGSQHGPPPLPLARMRIPNQASV